MSRTETPRTPTYGPYPGSTLDPNYLRSPSDHTSQSSSSPDRPLPTPTPSSISPPYPPASRPSTSHSTSLNNPAPPAPPAPPPPTTTTPYDPKLYTAQPTLAPSVLSKPSSQSAGAPTGNTEGSPLLPAAVNPSSATTAAPARAPSGLFLARKTPTFLCANGVCTAVDPGVRKIIVVTPEPEPAPANLLSYVLIAAFVMIFCNPLYGVAALGVALWGMTVSTDYHVAMQMGVISLWLSMLGVLTSLIVVLTYLIVYTPTDYYYYYN